MKAAVNKKDYIPTNVITLLIGSFEPLETLISYSITNKEHHAILSPLVEKLTFAEQSYQVTRDEELKDKISIDSSRKLTELYLNELKTRLLKKVQIKPEYAKIILQRALSKRFYTLIHVLLEQKIDINTSITAEETKSYNYTKIMCHGEGEVSGTRYEIYKSVSRVADVLWTSPVDLEKIQFYVQQGGDITPYKFLPYLFEQLQAIEKDSKAYSNRQKNIIAELLLYGYQHKLLQNMDEKSVTKLLQLIKHISHPLINCLEIDFLIKKLKELIPSNLNVFADRRDLPTIHIALSKLSNILYKATPEAAKELEYIKYLLLIKSKRLPETPGALIILLSKLKKYGIVICNPNYTIEQKPENALT